MPADRMDTCASCRFFSGEGSFKGWGECRRRSPSLTVQRLSTEAESVYQRQWPPVATGDWCGEYGARRG